MDREQRLGQEPGFNSAAQFDAVVQRPRPVVREFKMLPNGRLVFDGEPRGRSAPVAGTGKARRNSSHNSPRGR